MSENIDAYLGDRPSHHGKLLGDILALLADLGERESPVPLGQRCSTCAFRKGSVPNQTAGTGMTALNCVLGIDPDRFACHHGMKNGEPTRLCVGWMAARLVPWSSIKELVSMLSEELNGGPPEHDAVREAFDGWLKKIDPEGKMDVYQIARAALKAWEG